MNAFQIPALMPTLFTPPSPLYGVNPKSMYGWIETPSVFWRIPLKLYWFVTSTAPVTTTTGLSCAHAGDDSNVTITRVPSTDNPIRNTRVDDIKTLRGLGNICVL